MLNGMTFFHHVASEGRLRLARELLKRGVEHEVMEYGDKTPLDHAVLYGHVAVARLLLDRYAAKDEIKRALLRPWACVDGKSEPILVLAVTEYQEESPASHIEEAARLAMVRMLIAEYDASPFTPIKHRVYDGTLTSSSILHSAVTMGCTTIVDFLVEECGMSVDELALPSRLTPLHYACTTLALDNRELEEKLVRMIKFLIEEKGANVLARAWRGQTPATVCGMSVEGSLEGLDLGDDDKKEPSQEAKAKAKAEQEAEQEAEEVEEHDDTSSTSGNSLQDEDTFILEGAPEILLCPITTTLLVSPVLAAGYIYEEHAIQEWFATCRRKGNEITSPKTGAKMADMMMHARSKYGSILTRRRRNGK